jgi:hypothetical protein
VDALTYQERARSSLAIVALAAFPAAIPKDIRSGL